MSKHVREKCGKLCISSILSSQRGITPTKIGSKMTTLKLALWYIKTKSYTKFELNMSKHVGEKCGKLHICKNLKLKRSITPAKSDGN